MKSRDLGAGHAVRGEVVDLLIPEILDTVADEMVDRGFREGSARASSALPARTFLGRT